MRTPSWGKTAAVLATILVLACSRAERRPGERGDELSPTARPDLVEALRADLVAERHPADGGGSVAFLDSDPVAVVGEPGAWSFRFEAGPLGIAEGGWLFFQAPPFWGWSTPQVIAAEGFGYTEVTTEAEDILLEATTVDQQLLGIRIEGRDLEPGESVMIHYGAGRVGAMPDRFAERMSCFFFAVDGDGDGIRGLLSDRPCLEVRAGPVARLLLTLPSRSIPDERLPLIAAVLDAAGNRVEGWSGEIELLGTGGLEVSEPISISADDAGAIRTWIAPAELGVHRVMGRIVGTEVVAESNPVLIEDRAQRILWADLHGHSGLTDGTGTPRDYFRFARDVAGLDVIALTDHDHWGMEPLALHPELWEEIRRETELFHQPGRFVTLLGYEWTSWLHGHRHVLYFSNQGSILSSVDPEYESPVQLWEALRGQDVLTFAHHSAGGPVATNWQIPPDPTLEPITEIVSVHGSSEAMDSPAPIYSAVPGNFVRDVLDRGYRLGFVGSGDGHDGHPGLSHLGAPSGGLAAILSDESSRPAVREALERRRTYATNGPRIVLAVELAGEQMGSVIDSGWFAELNENRQTLDVDVVGESGMAAIDLVRSGRVAETIDCAGELRCAARFRVDDLRSDEYLYVRARQADGGAAWCSPFFVD